MENSTENKARTASWLVRLADVLPLVLAAAQVCVGRYAFDALGVTWMLLLSCWLPVLAFVFYLIVPETFWRDFPPENARRPKLRKLRWLLLLPVVYARVTASVVEGMLAVGDPERLLLFGGCMAVVLLVLCTLRRPRKLWSEWVLLVLMAVLLVRPLGYSVTFALGRPTRTEQGTVVQATVPDDWQDGDPCALTLRWEDRELSLDIPRGLCDTLTPGDDLSLWVLDTPMGIRLVTTAE